MKSAALLLMEVERVCGGGSEKRKAEKRGGIHGLISLSGL